jgi:hypothetical protein
LKKRSNPDELKNETFGLLEELNKIVEDHPKKLDKQSSLNRSIDSIKLSTHEKMDVEQKNLAPGLVSASSKKQPQTIAKPKPKQAFVKKETRINVGENVQIATKSQVSMGGGVLGSEEMTEDENVVQRAPPRQKVVSIEKKILDESISKAPSACQSVLKVKLIIISYFVNLSTH